MQLLLSVVSVCRLRISADDRIDIGQLFNELVVVKYWTCFLEKE